MLTQSVRFPLPNSDFSILMLRLRSFENVEERIVYYVFLPCQADEFIFRISSCNALLP